MRTSKGCARAPGYARQWGCLHASGIRASGRAFGRGWKRLYACNPPIRKALKRETDGLPFSLEENLDGGSASIFLKNKTCAFCSPLSAVQTPLSAMTSSPRHPHEGEGSNSVSPRPAENDLPTTLAILKEKRIALGAADLFEKIRILAAKLRADRDERIRLEAEL